MKSVCTALAASFALAVWAQVPIESPRAAGVRYIPYQADAVSVVRVRRGVVTRLVLDKSEVIKHHGTGFAARCDEPNDEWCILVPPDSHQIWVKPKTGATHNNLEVQTSLRDYSIRFEVLPDSASGSAGGDEVYRAIFVYPAKNAPVPLPPVRATVIADVASDVRPLAPPAAKAPVPDPTITALGCAGRYKAVNTNYTRDDKALDFVPLRVFDDGAHTVMVLGDSSPMPAVFAIGDDGGESRANFTVDGNCLAVHQLGRRFVLRLGSAALVVYNEGFAAGAASPRLRTLRESTRTFESRSFE